LKYEMTDHLGNVSTVVTARLLPGDDAPHEAFVIQAQGYEPFGSLLPGRNFSSSSYRFGFNGMEKDDEVNGATGTSYTAEFWQYDPRVVRRWNLDPVDQISVSNYAALDLSPIRMTDPKGNDPDKYSVDDDGNVKFMEKKAGPDELYKLDNNGKVEDVRFINDKSILPQLAETSTACNTDGQEALDVFHFMAKNTNVEWGLTGYKDGQFSLKTDHSTEGVNTTPPEFTSNTKLFSLHNHPRIGGNPEPSGPWGVDFNPFNGSDRSAAFWSRASGQRNFMFDPGTQNTIEYSFSSQLRTYSPLLSRAISTFTK